MSSLELITAINALLNLAMQMGINMQKLQALREQAAVEGRELTSDELRGLAEDAQAAIDRIK